LATCIWKPTGIVVSYNPKFYYEEDDWGIEKCWFLHFGSIQWLACRAILASVKLLICGGWVFGVLRIRC